jgi:hypothetical protein
MNALVDAMAEAFPLLAKGDDVGFMNKVSLLVPASQNGPDGKAVKTSDAGKAAKAPGGGKAVKTSGDGKAARTNGKE